MQMDPQAHTHANTANRSLFFKIKLLLDCNTRVHPQLQSHFDRETAHFSVAIRGALRFHWLAFLPPSLGKDGEGKPLFWKLHNTTLTLP